MPYTVVKRGNQWVTQKADGSKVFGRHGTKQEAQAQQRALYAAEKKG